MPKPMHSCAGAPGAEGHAAPAAQHAERLPEEGIRVGKMRHPEIADDGIEAAVRERERAGIALAEFDGRIVLPRQGKLRGGKIDPNDRGAVLDGGGRGIARPCRHI